MELEASSQQDEGVVFECERTQMQFYICHCGITVLEVITKHPAILTNSVRLLIVTGDVRGLVPLPIYLNKNSRYSIFTRCCLRLVCRCM
jgi:hypothetical protein